VPLLTRFVEADTNEGFTGVCDGSNCTEAPYSWVIDTNTLRTAAVARGAASFGVTAASPFTEARQKLVAHRALGLSGPLRFTYDEPDTATDVSASFPWARSIVVFAYDYLSRTTSPSTAGATVGRFATVNGYQPLNEIAMGLRDEMWEAGYRAEVLIDDNRMVDRSAAARAGVGWIGKSTMILAPGHGPWLLIGSVVTDAELEPTTPMIRGCGSCVACVPACPTAAITPEGLDASKCISTWLQTPGSLPHWIRPHIGRRIYGCDDCLTSCPPGQPALAKTSSEPSSLDFDELLTTDDKSLLERFEWWYVPRRDPRYIRRNTLVAAGNSRESAALPAIREHAKHRSSMIRSHAVWALARSLGPTVRSELGTLLAEETVPETIAEIEYAMTMTDS
jgi:epoxyqueuosine reductase